MTKTFELPALKNDGADLREWRMGFKVYQTLRQAIIRLELRPGHLLSEADVGRQLGVSRQPVREAFLKLSDVGLVEIRPQRGTVVKMISVHGVENARFLREAIEIAIVRRAAKLASPAAIQAMENQIREQQNVTPGDSDAFFRLDDAFHQSIAESAECVPAWGVLENLKSQLDRVRYLSLPDATPSAILIAQHARIIDAIARRSAADAEAAVVEHLGEIVVSLPKLAQQHAEIFVP